PSLTSIIIGCLWTSLSTVLASLTLLTKSSASSSRPLLSWGIYLSSHGLSNLETSFRGCFPSLGSCSSSSSLAPCFPLALSPWSMPDSSIFLESGRTSRPSLLQAAGFFSSLLGPLGLSSHTPLILCCAAVVVRVILGSD